MRYDYRTTPMTSSPAAAGGRYASKYTAYTTPARGEPKGHARRASHEPSSYTYATPKALAHHAPPAYSSPTYYTTTYAVPRRNDFASATDRMRAKARGRTEPRDSAKQQRSSRSQYVYNGFDDEGYYSPAQATPPPPYHEPYGYWGTDRDGYDAGHSYKQPEPPKYHKVRIRANSNPQKTPPLTKTRPSPAKSPPKATAADAARAHIPAGYSYKNWDPTEEPILLLGSVFDANSLGKWIYDWTVFHHGPATPMSDLAGDLWLLLIQLAGKVKRAEECIPRIRRLEDQDLVEDFLESGERLWHRFNKILKICEDYMWRAAKQESGGRSGKVVAMGPKSGCEFVDSIFGRDRKLEETERLMTGMRLWSMRFDANCEDILRRPGA